MKRRPLVAASFLSLVWKLSLFFAPPFVVHSASGSPTSDMFSYTGSLNTARDFHTATSLPNGKVLVAGGENNSSAFLTSAELYNPASGSWTATGSLNTARLWHTATLLSNGKVLVAGGYNGNGLSSAEVYDPASGSWTATGSLNTARGQHTATLLPNGKVLVAGGFNSSLNPSASAELYDPASGSWTATGSLNTARRQHTATLLPNGKVLVAGGSDNSAYLSSAELYDPASGSWVATGSLNTARDFHTATLLPNGKVLVAGGYDNGNYLTSAELYDPASGSWTATGSLNTARLWHTATLLPNGKVLVAGGVNASGIITSAELYDPASGSWTATGSLNTARQLHTATLLPNGKVLAAGGDNGNVGALTSAELYDPGAGPPLSVSIHSVPFVATPPRILNVNDDVDAALLLVPNETLLRSQPTITGGLVADGVTPLLIELDPTPVPTQATTFTINTTVTGGTVTNGLDSYLRVLQQTGTSQFVAGNSVVLSSSHPNGFAYISGIKSEDVQFDQGSKELNVTLTATQVGQQSNSVAVPFKIRKPPVVLVHGYNSDNSAWSDNPNDPNDQTIFMGKLRSALPEDFILRVQYGVSAHGDTNTNRDGSFDGLAPLLDEQLRNQVENPQSNWHLQWAFTRYNIVGHSQGGVLVRMLCTDDDPSPNVLPSDPNKFWKFRSPNNALRGRFDRVITLNAPQNGSTLAYFESRIAQVCPLCPQAALVAAGILQPKFDPWGNQMTTINMTNWHVDPDAKFHLIGTSIYGGRTPPATWPPTDRPPTVYVSGLLCVPLGPPYAANTATGTIVLPRGSDGVVDFDSQFAGNVPPPDSWTTYISSSNIPHSDPTWLFGVERPIPVTRNTTVAAKVAELLNGVSSKFQSWERQPLPMGLQAQIDPLAALALRNANAIQPSGRSSSSKTRARISGSSEVYNFILSPAPGQELSGMPNWNVVVFGPNGITTDGVTTVPNMSDPRRVAVTVDAAVYGDVVLSVNYVDTSGHSITGGPISVVSQTAGSVTTAIYLIPDTIALTVGSTIASEIWADDSNATRSRLFIPEGAAITYTSEDPTIASVDSMGTITLNSPGSTNIHVCTWVFLRNRQLPFQSHRHFL